MTAPCSSTVRSILTRSHTFDLGSSCGTGLGAKMLQHLLRRDGCDEVERLQTTITSDNDASWALFRKLARLEKGELGHTAHYTREGHFDGRHATEHMVTIDLPERMKKAA